VLESERAKERAVKQETAEQLAAFRKLRDDADRGLAGGGAAPAEVAAAAPELAGLDWAVSAGKKRKAGEKEGLRGLKVRRIAGKADGADAVGKSGAKAKDIAGSPKHQDEGASANSPPTGSGKTVAKQVPTGLGLAGYSSDEDDY
jgi:hypothetical protein